MPPVGGNFWFSSEEIWQNNARKHNFQSFYPPVGSSSPSVRKFLAPPLPAPSSPSNLAAANSLILLSSLQLLKNNEIVLMNVIHVRQKPPTFQLGESMDLLLGKVCFSLPWVPEPKNDKKTKIKKEGTICFHLNFEAGTQGSFSQSVAG